MTVAAVFLGAAALGGLSMVVMRLRGVPLPPTWLANVHGAIAAVGVAILGYAAFNPGIPGMAQAALGIFVLAAAGGVAIFSLYHKKGIPLPVPLILGHGSLAIVGYALLLASIFRGGL